MWPPRLPHPRIAFLHKPFTADSLGRKLREVLDGEAVPGWWTRREEWP